MGMGLRWTGPPTISKYNCQIRREAVSTFYYYEKAMLHVCGRAGTCSMRDYKRLMEKGKLTQERLKALMLVKEHGLLSLSMMAFLLKTEERRLYEDLETLCEYGLLMKQFYECQCDKEAIRTEGFYAIPPRMPIFEGKNRGREAFTWTRELRIEDAMSILAFNQFHIALAAHVPGRALRVWFDYHVRGVLISGRYYLKGRRYQLGYSHLMVMAVRDFAAHNKQAASDIHKVWEYYAYGEEKDSLVYLDL